jgi:hypothetical protein
MTLTKETITMNYPELYGRLGDDDVTAWTARIELQRTYNDPSRGRGVQEEVYLDLDLTETCPEQYKSLLEQMMSLGFTIIDVRTTIKRNVSCPHYPERYTIKEDTYWADVSTSDSDVENVQQAVDAVYGSAAAEALGLIGVLTEELVDQMNAEFCGD